MNGEGVEIPSIFPLEEDMENNNLSYKSHKIDEIMDFDGDKTAGVLFFNFVNGLL